MHATKTRDFICGGGGFVCGRHECQLYFLSDLSFDLERCHTTSNKNFPPRNPRHSKHRQIHRQNPNHQSTCSTAKVWFLPATPAFRSAADLVPRNVFLNADRTVCTFPPEYCEFGSSLTRCKEWLQEEHPDLFNKYYSDGPHTCLLTDGKVLIRLRLEALQAKVGTLSLEAQTKLEKDTAKKEAKAEARADAALKKKMVRILVRIDWGHLMLLSILT